MVHFTAPQEVQTVSLSEAEIQVLASLRRTELEGELADKATLEESRQRYWIFAVDWSDAYSSLVDKGLIQGDERCYQLTETGRPLAVTYHAERPDLSGTTTSTSTPGPMPVRLIRGFVRWYSARITARRGRRT